RTRTPGRVMAAAPAWEGGQEGRRQGRPGRAGAACRGEVLRGRERAAALGAPALPPGRADDGVGREQLLPPADRAAGRRSRDRPAVLARLRPARRPVALPVEA